MKRSILAALFFCSSALAAPKKVLIQTEDVSKVDYQAFLKTESEYTSFVDDQTENRALRSSQKELLAAFDLAERSFLSDTVEAAHQNYKQVIEMAFANDWTSGDRKLIFHSYLRAAQTAITKERRLEFLKSSIQFDSAQVPDDLLFPPPMVAEWKIEKTRNQSATLQLPTSYQNYEAALINGVRVDFKRFAVRVPNGSFRMTLLSNRYEPISKIATVAEFRKWEPESLPLVAGSCSAPVFSKAVDEESALFSGDCIAQANGSSAHSDTNKQNIASPLTRSFTRSSNNEKSIFQKPVFWGVAGVVVAFLAYSASRQHDDPPPTHKTGF